MEVTDNPKKPFFKLTAIFCTGNQCAHIQCHQALIFQRFRHITLPLLSPSTFFVIVISLINGFQVFDQVYVMTGGGPAGASQVVVGQIYDLTFRYGRAGEASALSWLLFLVILGVTALQIRGQRKWVNHA